MIASFEDLCNELLLCVFDYIDPRCLYKTFWNLNLRLNDLLASITRLQLIVDGEENRETIVSLAPHIGLLQVTTWDEIDLNGFRNLHSLILLRPSAMQLKQIRANTMPKLTYLSLFRNVYFTSPKELIDDVFSNRFAFLRWARLGHLDLSDFCYYNTQSYVLRQLHISCYHTSMIPFLLSTCPNLVYMHVDLLRCGDQINIPSPPGISNHPLQQLILRDYVRSISYKDIYTLLTYIPNTRKIELRFDCNTPFISLARHLSDSLSHLRRFDCDITESPINLATDLTTIQQIHPCFCRISCRTHETNFRIFATQ